MYMHCYATNILVSHRKDRVWWILRAPGCRFVASMLAFHALVRVRTHLVQDGDEEHLSTNEVRNFLVWVPQSMEYIELWVAGKRIAPLKIQGLLTEAVRGLYYSVYDLEYCSGTRRGCER